MGQLSDLFDITKKHLVGKMVFTDRGGVKIESIDVPESKEVFIISEEDLKNPVIDMFGYRVPVFAHGFSDYSGQCLFAVLGRDWESVDQYISKVKVYYSESADDTDFEEVAEEKTWSMGQEVDLSKITENEKVITSKFIINNHQSSLLGDQRIIADYSDEIISVKLATQWPLHVRDSIAAALGIARKAVDIFPVQSQAVFDELMLGPEIAGVVAATAAVKFDSLVEFSMPMTSYHGKFGFEIKTLIGESGSPVAQYADVKLNLGAFVVLSDEFINSVVAGLNPPYGLNYAQTIVHITKSHNPPAGIFSDLGYGMALAASENHYNQVIASLGIKQTEWRLDHMEMTPIKKSLYSSSQFASLSITLKDCASASWFDRQYAVNSQKGLANNRVNPFVRYSRGIGIACGQGVQGFSNKFSYLKHYSLSGVYHKDGTVRIACGMPSNAFTLGLWKDSVSSKLNIDSESISFADINSNEVNDIGPDALSRSLRTVPLLLESFSEKVKETLESESAEYPIKVSVGVGSVGKKEYYNSDSYGTIVVSLHIDAIMLVPVIDSIWARLQFGKVIDRVHLGNKMRQQISQTISELCPSAQNTYEINLKIDENPDKPIASGASLVRGLTAAALTSALSQALGHTVCELPVNEEDVLGIINKHHNSSEVKTEVAETQSNEDKL